MYLSASVEQLYCASLAFLGVYSALSLLFNLIIIILIFFSCHETVLISTHEVYFFSLVLDGVKP